MKFGVGSGVVFGNLAVDFGGCFVVIVRRSNRVGIDGLLDVELFLVVFLVCIGIVIGLIV